MEDNCFTILCWFLPNINMNQLQVYLCPLPLEPSPTTLPIPRWQSTFKGPVPAPHRPCPCLWDEQFEAVADHLLTHAPAWNPAFVSTGSLCQLPAVLCVGAPCFAFVHQQALSGHQMDQVGPELGFGEADQRCCLPGEQHPRWDGKVSGGQRGEMLAKA